MSLFSGTELFEAGTTNGGGIAGALRAGSGSPVRPSSAVNGEANTGASQTDNPSQMQPTSPTNGDGNTGASQAGSGSPVRPSSAANGEANTGASQTDNPSQMQPTSPTNGDATTAAAQTDSASRVRPSSPAASDGVGGALRMALVDEVGLSDEGLRSRLKVLGRAESTLAAMKSRALPELSRRHNKRNVQRLVRDELQTSKRDAKRDVETATRLAELPATSGALNSGDIPVGHAQLIARAAGESPIDERLLVEAANRLMSSCRL